MANVQRILQQLWSALLKITPVIIALLSCSFILLALSFYWAPWLLEIYVSFTPQIVIVGGLLLIMTVLLLWRSKSHFTQQSLKSNKLFYVLVIGLFAYAFCGLQFISRNHSAPNTHTHNGTYRIAQLNKLKSNTDYDAVANYMKSQQVEILGMEETKGSELRIIAEKMGYNYTYSSDDAPIGPHLPVGLISRKPIRNAQMVPLPNNHAVLRAEVETSSNRYMAVYVAHIIPPFSPQLATQSTTEFGALGAIIANEKLPIILVGDFNASIYSPKVQKFASQTNKVIQSTTRNAPPCSWYGYSSLFCLRIDHVYIPPSAKYDQIRISPDLGSDHRAVIVDMIY